MDGNSLPSPLSAKYKGTFGYYTVRDRLPVILTKVVDTLCRMNSKIADQYDEEHAESLKNICGRISQLKYEVQTNKPVTPIQDGWADAIVWDKYYKKQKTLIDGAEPCWFVSPWLYMECYMYRKIMESIHLSKLLGDKIDPFRDQKEQAFMTSQAATIAVSMDLMEKLTKLDEIAEPLKYIFVHYLKIALWGNKCDLSISGGDENTQTSCPLAQVDILEPYILVDNTSQVWDTLVAIKKAKSGHGQLDIVLDNAGFELVTDLCLAELLLSSGFVSKVVFHAKAMPWFVSDVTLHDFHWTLQMFCASNNMGMSHFGNLWQSRLKDGSWSLRVHEFWTLPHSFHEMEETVPKLYAELELSDFIFFKGDLNYRKLTSDRSWDFTTSFQKTLQGFTPAPLCTLRTLKCDTVVGLNPGQAEKVEKEDSDWMITGSYAVIQAYIP
ncbi:unnamed protein product [Owenia fusiformis]|uniref:Sugar phosphate phosphatase n=1 Tax=Owenia fusiformis TaxID=6347 RepID=A0A8S4PGN6_OWEFU|nr:unnamed protein product [Owenia fusiformis]